MCNPDHTRNTSLDLVGPAFPELFIDFHLTALYTQSHCFWNIVLPSSSLPVSDLDVSALGLLPQGNLPYFLLITHSIQYSSSLAVTTLCGDFLCDYCFLCLPAIDVTLHGADSGCTARGPSLVQRFVHTGVPECL